MASTWDSEPELWPKVLISPAPGLTLRRNPTYYMTLWLSAKKLYVVIILCLLFFSKWVFNFLGIHISLFADKMVWCLGYALKSSSKGGGKGVWACRFKKLIRDLIILCWSWWLLCVDTFVSSFCFAVYLKISVTKCFLKSDSPKISWKEKKKSCVQGRKRGQVKFPQGWGDRWEQCCWWAHQA